MNDCKGYVHSVETGGMVDGPGIRYVVFLAGCALRCKYCHNPDTWKIRPDQAQNVSGMVRDIMKFKSYMKFSGGGVTVTGGEPLGQPEFLAALLKECKAKGLHTALDTSGYGPRGAAEKALKHTDLLLLDIKTINATIYKDLTGVSIDRSLETLRLSQDLNIPVWIRFVMVPGYTDNFDDIQSLANFLAPFKNITKIEVLPFHKMGEYKWKNLAIPYELADVSPPSTDTLERAQKILWEDRGALPHTPRTFEKVRSKL